MLGEVDWAVASRTARPGCVARVLKSRRPNCNLILAAATAAPHHTSRLQLPMPHMFKTYVLSDL